MKIKRVECEQFAGLREKELQFADGLNIIIGDNESGKTTMVDLIYHLLFMPTKLDGRKQKHEEFMRLYFPRKVSGPQGDCVDGSLRFETREGSFRLFKEWIKNGGSSKLILPDGTVLRTEEQVNQILAQALGFGEGVYAELIFASQRRKQNLVESILQNLEQKKDAGVEGLRKELTSVISKAVLETGGVSLEKLEDKLTGILAEYTGRWDFDKNLPEDYARHGIGREWKMNAGIIVQAFYTKERLLKSLQEAEESEQQVELYKVKIREEEAYKKQLEEKRNQFQKYSGALREGTVLREQLMIKQQLLSERQEAKVQWPQVIEELGSAVLLQKKLEQALLKDKYTKVRIIQEDYQEAKESLKNRTEITMQDIRMVQKLLQEQSKLTGQITGLKLVAKIKQLGEKKIEVSTIALGEGLDTSKEELFITEAVKVQVPGVMEMQLLPQGVDVEAVTQKLAKVREQLAESLGKYDADSLEAMQEKAETYQTLKNNLQELENKLTIALGEQTWKQLQSEYESVPQVQESLDDIKHSISRLCGNKPLERLIGELSGSQIQYDIKYTSQEMLEQEIQTLQEQIGEILTRVDGLEQVPAEYHDITNTEDYETNLKNRIEASEERIKQLREVLSGAERRLGEKSAEEYTEEFLQAEAGFDSVKTTYRHWRHMYDTFLALKDSVRNNPTSDIAARFQEYLSVISADGLLLTTMDEQLAVQLSSANRALSYEILSEGTKDTISLAFRLAMLEHLYPDGGGMAVFDDPFTDMDPMRVHQACKLLEKYAQHNQVIFITCDEKYKNIMSGSVLYYKH